MFVCLVGGVDVGGGGGTIQICGCSVVFLSSIASSFGSITTFGSGGGAADDWYDGGRPGGGGGVGDLPRFIVGGGFARVAGFFI